MPEFPAAAFHGRRGPPSGKHLLLFISHNKGCQYYVGNYDAQAGRFAPDRHGRMTWIDNTYFAPEALIDGQGRQIMWAWLTDNPGGEKERGWSGVYGLPRTLWLGADGTPANGSRTRTEHAPYPRASLGGTRVDRCQQACALDGVRGDACELEIVIDPAAAKQVGVKVRRSPGGEEETLIYYNAEQKCLCFDGTRSGIDGRRVLESAPLESATGEPLKLRVFVDRSVVEVYANERQAIGRRVYPGRTDSLGVSLFSRRWNRQSRQRPGLGDDAGESVLSHDHARWRISAQFLRLQPKGISLHAAGTRRQVNQFGEIRLGDAIRTQTRDVQVCAQLADPTLAVQRGPHGLPVRHCATSSKRCKAAKPVCRCCRAWMLTAMT